jgi:hypothetical protein
LRFYSAVNQFNRDPKDTAEKVGQGRSDSAGIRLTQATWP